MHRGIFVVQLACHLGGFGLMQHLALQLAIRQLSILSFDSVSSPNLRFGHVVRIYSDLSHGTRQPCLHCNTHTPPSGFSVHRRQPAECESRRCSRSQQRGRCSPAASPLPLPPLNPLASMQDLSEEEGDEPFQSHVFSNTSQVKHKGPCTLLGPGG